MSSSAVTPGIATTSLVSLRVFRYAVGSTLAMAIAMGVDWQLSFLAPVLALSFLGTPTPRPTVREGVAFLATIGLACFAGLLLARYLLPYPLVFLPFVGLVLFRLFHAKESGAPALLVTWMIIALLAIPLLAMTSAALANLVALGIVFGAAVTLGIVWLTYGLLPDPPGTHDGVTASAPTGAPPPTSAAERLRSATLSTAVVCPLFVAFYLFQWTGALLILIFVALLSMQPAFAKNFKVGGAMVIGNVIGGAAAIVFYELLVVSPLYELLILLTLLGGLFFGARVFSGEKTAPLYGMAFSTVLLIIGSTTTSTSSGAEGKVYMRVLQIMVAVVYVVTAFGVLDRFVRPKDA
jgi:hypothetical protein